MKTIIPTLEPIRLELLQCGECSIQFAVPDYWLADKRRTKDQFTCPNGHVRVFRKTEEDALREQLAAKDEEMKWRAKWQDEELQRTKKDRDSFKFKAMAERGHKVRLQKRIANGVCPCCTRSFANLSQHMAHMHPDFVPTEGAK